MTPYFIAQVNYGHGWYDLTIAKHYPTVEAAKDAIEARRGPGARYQILEVLPVVVWES